MGERSGITWIRLLVGLMGIVLMARFMMGTETAPAATSVEADGAGLTFSLENVPPGTDPALSVNSETNLDAFLRRTGRRGSRWLPNLALSNYPAVLLNYTWDLGYERVSGEYLYVHKEYPHPWKVRQEDGLTVYYATGVVGWRIDRWVELNDWVSRFLGTPRQPVTIYAMPDDESYDRMIRGHGYLGKAAAFWNGTRKWIVLRPGQGEEVVAHEMAHAYLFRGNPLWWEEGVATWVEVNYQARTSPQAFLYWKGQLEPLAEQAAHEPVDLNQVGIDSQAPADPYRVGLSLLLYLESRLGTEAVKQMALLAREVPLDQLFAQRLGQGLDEVAADWNQALATGELQRWMEEQVTPP